MEFCLLQGLVYFIHTVLNRIGTPVFCTYILTYVLNSVWMFYADPDPGQTLKSQFNFYMKNILKVDTVFGKKKDFRKFTKAFLKEDYL